MARQLTSKTGPTFCWHCNKQLMRMPGGVYSFRLLKEKATQTLRRVHGAQCSEACLADGSCEEPKHAS